MARTATHMLTLTIPVRFNGVMTRNVLAVEDGPFGSGRFVVEGTGWVKTDIIETANLL